MKHRNVTPKPRRNNEENEYSPVKIRKPLDSSKTRGKIEKEKEVSKSEEKTCARALRTCPHIRTPAELSAKKSIEKSGQTAAPRGE